MRKLLTLIGAWLLCLAFTAQADVKGDGSWSAILVHWEEGDIPISGQTVNGKFSGNQLVVDKILTNDALLSAGNEYFQPLTLTIDMATGEARGENQLAFEYPGYAAYDCYYCDNDKIGGKPWVITGKFVNTGDGKSKLTLSEWCTKYNNVAGRGGPGYWKDSQVIFNFEVEGLVTEGAPQIPTPTIVPPSSTLQGSDDDNWYYLPGAVTVNWGDEDISINTNSSAYDSHFNRLNVTVKLNGQQVTLDEWGMPADLYAQVCEDVGYWEVVSVGKTLVIQGLGSIGKITDGQVYEVSLPAGAVNVGSGLSEAISITYTVGDVEYDDSKVKTFGSKVTFNGPDSCPFITRLNDNVDMCVASDSELNLGDFISMIFKVDPSNPQYDRAYNFDVIKQADGTYAYNFKNVTYNECVFNYTGTNPVTFTFQRELAVGEQEGGMKNMGELQLGVPFKMEQNQVYTYTFPEAEQGDFYIMLTSNNDVLQNGTLKVLNNGDFDLTEAWKQGENKYTFIAANNGTQWGYTGSFNMTAGYKIYVQYTGATPIELRMDWGEFTKYGVAQYMNPATYTPTKITTADTNAAIAISWGQEMTMRHSDYGISYSFDGEYQAAVLEIGNYTQFADPATLTGVKEGESGNTLYLMMGDALNGEPQVGTYQFTIPQGTLQNAEGLLNSKQVITVEVTEPQPNVLVFKDFEMELGTTETTVAVPVSIEAEEEFTYQGIQFTVTLPEGLTIEEGGIVLNDTLDGKATWNTSDTLYGKPNTTSVVVLLNEPTAAVEDILTIKVTGTYGDLEEGTYPITIQKVGFSDARGNDIETPEFEAFTGYVTITAAEVPAESITIDSVTLNEPSFTETPSNMVEEVVAGESVDMTITVLPADTTDETSVTADNEGVTITDNGDGTWTVDTSGVVVPEGEKSVDVTITVKAGDIEEEYTLTVNAVVLGDSNDNGKVTVADVVTTANYIATKPIAAFCWPNANVITNDTEAPGNRDGITVQDVTATVQIVLDTFDGIRNPQNVRRQANRVVSNDRLVADNFGAGRNTIGINLESTAAYAALQATIEIPAGMKVENVTVGQRAANHELVYNVTGNELHVVLFSYTNEAFANGEGSLFNISVTADENCGDLVMTNILASDANSNGYELASEGGMQSEITGIDGIGAEEAGVRYFTVDGGEVVRPEAGQILIRVQNGNATKVLVK